MTLSSSNQIGTGSSRSACSQLVALVYVYTTIKGVAVESFRTQASVVSGGVLTEGILATDVGLLTFIHIYVKKL